MAKGRKQSGLDAEIAGLYGLPLEEFTAERNALASRLRKAGRRDEAGEVASLPKPSVSAWAVNMLFQRERERMDGLLAAGDRARAALRQVIAGGSAEGLKETLETARDLVAELGRRAVEILSEGGRAPGAAIVERIGTDLQALAFSPVAAGEAARGWLTGDLDPPGFEVLAGLQLAAAPARRREPAAPARPAAKPARPAPAEKPARTTPTDAAARRREAAERAREEREEAKQREREEREATRRREQREREVAKLEERVARAEEEAASRGHEARAAEKEAEEASRRAEAARRAAERARERADTADAALARARAELEAARSGDDETPRRLRLVPRRKE